MRCKNQHSIEVQHFEPQHYQIPEEAHAQLINIRDHLRMLARMTQARSPQDDLPGYELQIAPAPLALFFSQLANELDACVQAASYHRRETKQP